MTIIKLNAHKTNDYKVFYWHALSSNTEMLHLTDCTKIYMLSQGSLRQASKIIFHRHGPIHSAKPFFF